MSIKPPPPPPPHVPYLAQVSDAGLDILVEDLHNGLEAHQEALKVVHQELVARGRAFGAEQVSAMIRGQEV